MLSVKEVVSEGILWKGDYPSPHIVSYTSSTNWIWSDSSRFDSYYLDSELIRFKVTFIGRKKKEKEEREKSGRTKRSRMREKEKRRKKMSNHVSFSD